MDNKKYIFPLSAEIHALANQIAAVRDGIPGREPVFVGPGGTLAANVLGALGEIIFAKYYNLEVDMKARKGGDKGIDFIVYINGHRITIDVKTAAKRDVLLLPVKKMPDCASFLVLAHHDKVLNHVELCGWDVRGLFALSVPRVFYPPNGPLDYHRPVGQLNSMEHLDWLMSQRTTYEQTDNGNAVALAR